MSHKYIFKYIIIGDMGVGKSCIMQRFTEQRFKKDLPHTIGVEFGTMIVDINGELVKLQIWDTAGQERFRSVTRGYYRGAAGALLVYDVSRRATFAHIGTWLADARSNTNPHTVMILIGNKCDLEEQREVSFEEASKFAEENNLLFLECSALNGDNVEQAFLSTARKIHEKVMCGILNPTDPDSGVQLHATTLTTTQPKKEEQKKDKCDC
ncbi:ras-related GTP-binding protein, putative [Bodo saltans]|jgi:Ras-related protein Rab-14|uniref:Ras-related GTP-binding protein, putative n=1 Tax=Bodo saltans TaxID=75058 RepID=A0A0S4IWV0_BODSA|nr:ras-related GTP-binding protein, putative [Bodo saltans]|eukprot:CUG06034.1 ras-related GTP-binding protein, putative [Bodo saltans]